MEGEENSTFFKEKMRFKEVKTRLEKTPLEMKPIEVIPPSDPGEEKEDVVNKSVVMSKDSVNIQEESVIIQEQSVDIQEENLNIQEENLNIQKDSMIIQEQSVIFKGDNYEITENLIGFILETIRKLCRNSFSREESTEGIKMKQIQRKTVELIQMVNENVGTLKDTNDVVYSVLHKMDSICREAVLNSSTLLGIVEGILLRFCEVGDLLDFDQEENTIEALFEMSKLIYIYKSRVNEIVKDDIKIDEEYKRNNFKFYFLTTPVEEEDALEDSPYTDWTSWIGTFINESLVEGDVFKEEERQLIKEESYSAVDKPLDVSYSAVDKPLDYPLTREQSVEDLPLNIKLSDSPLDIKPLEDSPLNVEDRPLVPHSLSTTPHLVTSTLKVLTTKKMEKELKIKTVYFSSLQKDVVKIGEATFSEVFRRKTSIFKIIPLGREEGLTRYHVFVREAFIQKTLSEHRGVCTLKRVRLVKGRYTQAYLKAWDEYGVEENERPCKYKSYQLYGLLVMNEGGIPLEKADFSSFSLVSFTKLLVKTLSSLEKNFEFEHRDLHWGNILIRKRSIRIIDFTLSRLKKGDHIVYNDLSKYNWLFTGDSSVDEQFEIYRKMRDACEGDWASFNPSSNFYWVEYLVKKCLKNILIHREETVAEKKLLLEIKYKSTVRELEMALEKF